MVSNAYEELENRPVLVNTPNNISLRRKSLFKSGIKRVSNAFRRSLNPISQNSAFTYTNEDINPQNVNKIIKEQFTSITSTQSGNVDQPDGPRQSETTFVFGQKDENNRNLPILGWLI